MGCRMGKGRLREVRLEGRLRIVGTGGFFAGKDKKGLGRGWKDVKKGREEGREFSSEKAPASYFSDRRKWGATFTKKNSSAGKAEKKNRGRILKKREKNDMTSREKN